MRRVIIESPFSGDTARNKRYLTACIRDCIKRGESPYASHRMLTEALDDNDPAERELGIAAGFAWRSAAAATVVYTDLGTSGGMRLGIEAAQAMGHPIEYRELGGQWDTAARDDHEFAGDGYDCALCGEGRQFYLHTDRDPQT